MKRTPSPPEPGNWTRGGFLLVVAVLFAGQAGLLLLFAERARPAPVPADRRAVVRLMGAPLSVEDLSKFIFAADPTVFPSSAPRGFADQAWLKAPALEYKLRERSNAPNFLEFSASRIGANLIPPGPAHPGFRSRWPSSRGRRSKRHLFFGDRARPARIVYSHRRRFGGPPDRGARRFARLAQRQFAAQLGRPVRRQPRRAGRFRPIVGRLRLAGRRRQRRRDRRRPALPSRREKPRRTGLGDGDLLLENHRAAAGRQCAGRRRSRSAAVARAFAQCNAIDPTCRPRRSFPPMCFLCLRPFRCWRYIRRFGAGVFGRRGRRTAYSDASVADRFTRTMPTWIVRVARNAEH